MTTPQLAHLVSQIVDPLCGGLFVGHLVTFVVPHYNRTAPTPPAHRATALRRAGSSRLYRSTIPPVLPPVVPAHPALPPTLPPDCVAGYHTATRTAVTPLFPRWFCHALMPSSRLPCLLYDAFARTTGHGLISRNVPFNVFFFIANARSFPAAARLTRRLACRPARCLPLRRYDAHAATRVHRLQRCLAACSAFWLR